MLFLQGLVHRYSGRKNTPFHRPRRKHDTDFEHKKVVIHTSLPRALRRCILHILPMCSTILILVINIRCVFVGSDFVGPIKSETINLMLLQLAAKAHELLIVASLGLVILHMVRHELLFGDGLPLGLVGSGLTFSNIAYFFHKEFYASLKYVAKGHPIRKLCFVTILIIAGLTAGLAGPASAVLLVPKVQAWPIGGTPFYLNGSSDRFWSWDLSGTLPELASHCSTSNSTRVSVCPGAGYVSLWQHWGRMNYTNFSKQNVRPYALDLSGSHFYWPVASPDSIIPPRFALGDFRKDDQLASNTFLVQPHAAVATILQHIADDWWDLLVNEQKIDIRIVDDRQISALFVPTPITSVRCSKPQNLSLTDSLVKLPTIEGRFTYSKLSDLKLNTSSNAGADHLRFNWVHLPDSFGTASIGGIFESPWTVGNDSRIVIGCTAQLGYIPTTLYTDKYTFWTGWYPWNLRFGERIPSFTPVPPGALLPPTNGRIALGDDWLSLLTPPSPLNTPSNSGWQPSTIESILLNSGLGDIPSSLNGTDATSDWLNTDKQGAGRTAFLEAIIASVLVDGLSRTGSHRIFKTDGPSSQWPLSMYDPEPEFGRLLFSNQTAFTKPDVESENLTSLRVDMFISGFSFRGSLAGYLAMSVLLVHMVIASAHIAVILFHRHSSWSWSTISDLIALSQNSTPPGNALKNTGAGVNKAATFAKIAKIRVKPASRSDDADCVELIFEDDILPTNVATTNSDEVHLEMQTQNRHSVTNEQDLRVSSRITSAVTWPREQGKSSHAPDVSEFTSRSSSRERLVPRAYFAGARTRDSIVKVDTRYG